MNCVTYVVKFRFSLSIVTQSRRKKERGAELVVLSPRVMLSEPQLSTRVHTIHSTPNQGPYYEDALQHQRDMSTPLAHVFSPHQSQPQVVSSPPQYHHYHYHCSFSPLVSTRRSILAQFANRCGSMPFPTEDSGSIDFACAIDDST